MSTFVLLHGAFHGAWCWERVAPLLERAGHLVVTPTQTGVGERAHLLGPGLSLQTFVDDLVSVLKQEALREAVLVGHSFGGHAVSGAAEAVPERIRRLIYLDSALPRSGVTPLEGGHRAISALRRKQAEEAGGLALPPPEPGTFGVPEGPDADWVRSRLTPHPFATMDTALTLRAPLGNGLPATYVACTEPYYAGLASSRALAAELAETLPNWRYVTLAAGHDAMVTAPAATAALLMEIAP